MADRLLTVNEVAERLRANPETVRRWLRQGKLKGMRPGGDRFGYRIRESEVERFIRQEQSQARDMGQLGNWGYILGQADAILTEARAIADDTEDASTRVNYQAFTETEFYKGLDASGRKVFAFAWDRGYGAEIGADPIDFR